MSLLWQPRWIVGHVLVLAIVVSFVRLGFWQLDRHAEHVAENERLSERLAEPVVSLQALLADHGFLSEPILERGVLAGATSAAAASESEPNGAASADRSAADAAAREALAFRRVRVTGRFEPSDEILLRNQTLQGRPGWHVLTPLVVSDAGLDGADLAVIVDRGWVPQGLDQPPVSEATPPAGPVELEGILIPERDPPAGPLAGLAARNPETGTLERTFIVDVERLAGQIDAALAPVYLVPTSQVPAQEGDLPVPPEPPAPGPASHLGYAVQWFVFASIGVIGYTFLLRQRIGEHTRAERA